MVRVKAVCVGCGRSRVFVGEDLDTIIRQIDEEGWLDAPSPRGKGVEFTCPKCAREANPDPQDRR